METHDEGRVIVFDDSRNHRAFCYGDDDRIVLILDLERSDSLPKGTATGASDLLSFIPIIHVAHETLFNRRPHGRVRQIYRAIDIVE